MMRRPINQLVAQGIMPREYQNTFYLFRATRRSSDRRWLNAICRTAISGASDESRGGAARARATRVGERILFTIQTLLLMRATNLPILKEIIVYLQ